MYGHRWLKIVMDDPELAVKPGSLFLSDVSDVIIFS